MATQPIADNPPPSPAPRPLPRRRWLRRTLAALVVVVAFVALAALAGGLWLRGRLEASLPLLDGERAVAGLGAAVTVERDALGVPTIRGESLPDVAWALGFVHAQDRFFQMDLLRRRPAGELSELFGELALEVDVTNRRHRFRDVARRVVAMAGPGERELVAAYAEGVNAGLAALGEKPFEHLALGVDTAPWRPEDTVLAVHSMFLELHDSDGSRDSMLGVMADTLPPALFEFLANPGTEWDAPIVGEASRTPPVPGPEVVLALGAREDFGPAAARSSEDGAQLSEPAGRVREHRPQPARRRAKSSRALGPPAARPFRAARRHEPGVHALAGSNNWAVAGAHTANGGALLANDMHLGISVPNTWYRAALVWREGGEERRVTGVTLPGTPTVVVGSTGRVAWGFTNSFGDWTDLVVLETDPTAPKDPEVYRTPDGPRRVERVRETIRVKGGADRVIEVPTTVWGPIVDRDHQGRPRALAWTAHHPEAVNFGIVRLAGARDLDEAIAIATTTGIPPQNFVAADASGRIGWTIMGRMPRRLGWDGRLPVSWADGARGWDGWLDPAEVPRVVDPPSGRVWTANSRVVDGEMLARLGDGGYDLGARARQIRDGLLAVERATPRDMLAIQLDDRALLLERWRGLLLEALTPGAIAADPRRHELRELVERTWTGHASVDSAAYRLVRAFRLTFRDQIFERLTAPARAADPRFDHTDLVQFEGPLWRLATERPAHLLDPRFESWNEALLAAADLMIAELGSTGRGGLAGRSWGERNTTRIRHPLSGGIPLAGRWLDVPPRQLPGDANLPRVTGPGFGASERLVVSPGREGEGFFHMPVGQSGHPLSPHYRDGHEAWEEGRPTPFLPGPAVHTLRLVPAGS